MALPPQGTVGFPQEPAGGCCGPTRTPAGRCVRARSERGSATLELVVIFPAVLLIFWAGLQAAMYYHARSIALAAAHEGTRVASAEYGTQGAGSAAATSFAQRAGRGTLIGAQVNISRSAAAVTTTVTGSSISVVPGAAWPISQTVTLPVERVTR